LHRSHIDDAHAACRSPRRRGGRRQQLRHRIDEHERAAASQLVADTIVRFRGVTGLDRLGNSCRAGCSAGQGFGQGRAHAAGTATNVQDGWSRCR
jgi:hypothetical protein